MHEAITLFALDCVILVALSLTLAIFHGLGYNVFVPNRAAPSYSVRFYVQMCCLLVLISTLRHLSEIFEPVDVPTDVPAQDAPDLIISDRAQGNFTIALFGAVFFHFLLSTSVCLIAKNDCAEETLRAPFICSILLFCVLTSPIPLFLGL
jgi:hypothetical protein